MTGSSSSTAIAPNAVADAALAIDAGGECGLQLLRSAITVVADEDLSAVDDANLLADVVVLHTEMQRLQATWLARIAEADRRQAPAIEEGAVSTTSWLRHACRMPGPAASTAVRVSQRLPNLPMLAEAVAAGRVGLDAARILTRALTPERLAAAQAAGRDVDEVQHVLVGLAEVAEPMMLRDQAQTWADAWDPVPDPKDAEQPEPASQFFASRTLDGIVQTNGSFNAMDGEVLLTALESLSAPTGSDDLRTAAQRRADALIELIRRSLDAGDLPENGGERPHVGLLVPLDALVGNTQAGADATTGFSEPVGAEQDPRDHDWPSAADGDVPDGAATPTLPGMDDYVPRQRATDPDCRHMNRLLGNLSDRAGADFGPGAPDGRTDSERLTGINGISDLREFGRLFGIGHAALLTHTGPIRRESARLLACDSMLHRIVVGPNSMPLDVGRAQRIVPPSIRRALYVRDGGCAFPGCDRPPEWTQAHHIIFWADGGETSLDNCVLLCRRHHSIIHHTLWTVRSVPGGRPIFTRPDGTDAHPPPPARAG